jgi:predicted O-linked N-acetylglucosamine transferase (SPINDLY family)
VIEHDRDGFEVCCYSDVGPPDAVTARLKKAAGRWTDVRPRSDEEVAGIIRRDGIDVPVDPIGHMGGSWILVFARKPAPLQPD